MITISGRAGFGKYLQKTPQVWEDEEANKRKVSLKVKDNW
jgi:hypothetical protein